LREFKFQSDPSQPYIYGRAKQDLERQSQNPYGAYTTPAVREAALKTGTMNLTQQQGQASAQENAQLNNMQYAQKAGVADLTRPQLVQMGGSYSGTGAGTGTSQQSGGLGQMLLGGLMQGGSAAAGNTALM
jgi:hypothetical protein